MATDRPNDEPTPLRPPAPRDADEALTAMGHDARNGLATIVARAQMLLRRLRRGGPVERNAVEHGLTEVERVAKRTARRIEEIERPFLARRVGDADDAPIGDRAPDREEGGRP
jgi:hypothetical protein